MYINYYDLNVQKLQGFTFSAAQFVNAGVDIKKCIAELNKTCHGVYIIETGVCSGLEVRTRLEQGSVLDIILEYFAESLQINSPTATV